MNAYRIVQVHPTDEFQVSLRRYLNPPVGFPTSFDVEQTSVVIGRERRDDIEPGLNGAGSSDDGGRFLASDPRWPRVSAITRQAFREDDGRVVDVDRLYRTPSGELLTVRDLPVGAAYYDAHPLPFPKLSVEFEQHHAGRRHPIKIKLPDGTWFSPDHAYWGGGERNPQRRGWSVTGRLEDGDLAVSPSVHLPGYYHGWIGTAGTPPGHVSRDIEGKPY